jgi:small GTP-binding protein
MSDIIRKVCMFGDPSVGKTSLVRRFVLGKYEEKYKSTLGTVIYKKETRSTKMNKSMMLMIWDISGQAEFKRIHASAFSNATGGFVVCDITRPETCEHVKDWVQTFKKYAGDNVPIIALGNKSDLIESGNAYGESCGLIFKEMNIPFIMTSAKTGVKVEESFGLLADEIFKFRSVTIDSSPNPNLLFMPDRLFSASELLDFMVVKFCDVLGDEEMGMFMVRKQVETKKIDFNHITKDEAEDLIEPLTSLIGQFKGQEKATELRMEFAKASERCKGC